MNKNTIRQNKWVRRGLLGAAVMTLSGGLLVAQMPGRGGPGAAGFHGRMLRMAAWALDLSDAQQTQIRTIFEDAHTANESVREAGRKIHEEAVAAVKAGKSDAELARIATSATPVITQVLTAHMVTMSKVYKVLTPAQREKAEKLHNQMRERFTNGRERFGPPR